MTTANTDRGRDLICPPSAKVLGDCGRIDAGGIQSAIPAMDGGSGLLTRANGRCWSPYVGEQRLGYLGPAAYVIRS